MVKIHYDIKQSVIRILSKLQEIHFQTVYIKYKKSHF